MRTQADYFEQLRRYNKPQLTLIQEFLEMRLGIARNSVEALTDINQIQRKFGEIGELKFLINFLETAKTNGTPTNTGSTGTYEGTEDRAE